MTNLPEKKTESTVKRLNIYRMMPPLSPRPARPWSYGKDTIDSKIIKQLKHSNLPIAIGDLYKELSKDDKFVYSYKTLQRRIIYLSNKKKIETIKKMGGGGGTTTLIFKVNED